MPLELRAGNLWEHMPGACLSTPRVPVLHSITNVERQPRPCKSGNNDNCYTLANGELTFALQINKDSHLGVTERTPVAKSTVKIAK
jgi:hypothetical protein